MVVKRVHRLILPTNMLCSRVRAVFVFYSDNMDGFTRKPLFNDRSWVRAKKIIKEMLMVNNRDPPSM